MQMTKKKQPKKLQMQSGLTEADRVVLKIINDDEEMDDHISAMSLINHFKSYEASLSKFHVSEDELFEKLSIKNKKIEEY